MEKVGKVTKVTKQVTKKKPKLPEKRAYTVKLRYTDEERMQAVRMLVDSGFNYALTEQKTHVQANTLKQWYYRMKDAVEKEATSYIAEKVEIDFARAKLNLLKSNYDGINKLTEAALERATQLIKKENDLNKLNGTLRIIADLLIKMNNGNGQDDQNGQSQSNAMINLIQDSVVQLNNMSKENIDKMKGGEEI